MAVGDVYVVKMFTDQFDEAMLNVFYYRTNFQAGSENAQDIFNAFDTQLLDSWAGCVLASISILSVEVFAINNPSDFHSAVPINNVGTRVDSALIRLPTYLCFGYKSNRAGAGTRSSFKRFSGMEEADVQANSLSAVFLALTPVQDLQSDMGNILVGPLGSIWEPVQVQSGWLVGFAPTVNFVLTDWLVPTLTSQVSRKPT